MKKTATKKTKNSVNNTKKTIKPTKNVKSTKTKGKEVMEQFDIKTAVESKKMLIILIAVIAVLGLFYLIAGIITGDIDLDKNEPVEIQYSEILAGSTFKQNDDEYLVLYYDFTEEDASNYLTIISNFTSNEDNPSLYTVDLSRKFNSTYLIEETDNSNTNPTNASELRIKNPTLIRIKDKKVTDYKEGYENIKDYMSNSSK